MDAAIEVTVDVEEACFAAHELLIRSAGKIQLQAARSQCFEKRAGAGDEVLFGRAALGEFIEAVADLPVEALQVGALVLERIEGLAAIAADLIGQLDHLVDRLLPGQAGDALLDACTELVHGLALRNIGEDFHHHGDHHIHPAGSDERDGAVKIEEADAGVSGGNARVELFDDQSRISICCSRPGVDYTSDPSGGAMPREWLAISRGGRTSAPRTHVLGGAPSWLPLRTSPAARLGTRRSSMKPCVGR